MKKKILAWLAAILCVCLCAAPLRARAAFTADATELISPTQECTLTLHYAYNGAGFSDVPVRLYKIAEVSADYRYTLTERFQPTALQLNGVSSAQEWDTIRTTLESYIVANELAADALCQTDENGAVTFRDLTAGMYLVAPVQCAQNGFRYYFASILAAVPDLNEDGTWNYDVNALPKADVNNPTGEDLEYQVLKLWKDSENTSKRPTEIEVEILRNGKAVKTVVLSEENHWSYTWFAEDDGSVWQVVEKNIPEGYVMTVEKHTTTFTIVNSVPNPPDNPQNPDTGDTSHVGLYVLLLCVSGVVLLLLSLTGKKKAR